MPECRISGLHSISYRLLFPGISHRILLLSPDPVLTGRTSITALNQARKIAEMMKAAGQRDPGDGQISMLQEVAADPEPVRIQKVDRSLLQITFEDEAAFISAYIVFGLL